MQDEAPACGATRTGESHLGGPGEPAKPTGADPLGTTSGASPTQNRDAPNKFTGTILCQDLTGTFLTGTINTTVSAACGSLKGAKLTCPCDGSSSWAFKVACTECDE